MKTIQNILILCLIAIIVYLFFFRKPGKQVISDTKYKTDTFYSPQPYPVPHLYPYIINPKVITIFSKDTKAIDSLTVLLSEKDIIIQGLHSQIIISQDYLKQFPRNPKLIELDLSVDTLFLSALGLDGFIKQSSFPIRLNAFNYKWTIDGLSKTPSKPLPTPKTPISLWGGGGLNLLYASPTLDFTAEKDWARIRAFGDIRIGLLNKYATSANLGLKYKFR